MCTYNQRTRIRIKYVECFKSNHVSIINIELDEIDNAVNESEKLMSDLERKLDTRIR